MTDGQDGTQPVPGKGTASGWPWLTAMIRFVPHPCRRHWLVLLATALTGGAIWLAYLDIAAGGVWHEVIRNYGLLVIAVWAAVIAVWRGRIADQQVKVAERGLMHERLLKGAEMLGSENMATRPRHREKPPVMPVCGAFVGKPPRHCAFR